MVISVKKEKISKRQFGSPPSSKSFEGSLTLIVYMTDPVEADEFISHIKPIFNTTIENNISHSQATIYYDYVDDSFYNFSEPSSFRDADKDYIQGFSIIINQTNPDLSTFLPKAYDTFHVFLYELSSNNLLSISNKSVFLNVTHEYLSNSEIYKKLLHSEFNPESIKISSVRGSRSSLSLPIKDKYTIKRFSSIIE